VAQPIHPLDATRKLSEDYARYLRTIYFFRDAELRGQFQKALETPGFLVRGPILEAAPPFRLGRSIRKLVEAGVLHRDFGQLCSAALPYDRPLYLHQDEAITKVAAYSRNVVVATGTGSGKTETFLIPIFDHLLRQREVGLLGQPGVRALLLYPMNALANDQLKRLRRLLAHFPDITFGRYTGETPEGQRQAEELFRQQFPAERLLPNERISRAAMWESPPHILITNYAMLEYLLLRPRDSEFFDGETGHFWRFIVLDEAHIYDGATGIEIAMLLRRVKDRVVRSEPGRLRCIATSATLGRGRQDFGAVATFASELFGERFEWADEDPRRQDVVEGQREEMAQLTEPWGEGSGELYAALVRAVAAEQPPAELASLVLAGGLPPEVVQSASRAADQAMSQAASSTEQRTAAGTNAFLYAALRGDGRLHRLRAALQEPQDLRALPGKLGADGTDAEALINLVQLAVRARPEPDAMSLLPARYHVFARALEGAFVCLNRNDPRHANEGKPRFFLTRFDNCPHCQRRVFELATCPRCGTAYIVGREETAHLAGWGAVSILRHPHPASAETDGGHAYFVLEGDALQPDEDEAVVTQAAVDLLGTERLEPYTLCLGCGVVAPAEGGGPRCNCRPTTPRVALRKVEVEEPSAANGTSAARRSRREAGVLSYCIGCGARNPNGVVYRFLTGQDAPVSVLATSLYQVLPPDRSPDAAELPGHGRKLLVFADSRQDAAFFAPYLERTYQQILRRRLILKILAEDPDGRTGRLRLEDLAGRLVRQAEAAALFTAEQSYDQRLTLAHQWLAQEFVALDYRIGLEGLGLLSYRLVPPDGWAPPPALLAPPWNLSREEAWDLLVLLLNTLRQQGAVTFPPNVDVRDRDAFGPRNVELFVGEVANEKHGVLGWAPRRGSNRRLDFLARLLQRRSGLSAKQAQTIAQETLQGLWTYLTGPSSRWRDHLVAKSRPQVGVAWRLNYRFWEWVPVEGAGIPVYRCDHCANVSYINLNDLCPFYGCNGHLVRVDAGDAAWDDNHYRHLYRTLEPISVTAEEHTAQWKPDEAGKVQDRFIRGQINVLSCSTTFELGVDVGDLQAVLMRNVPPTTANYIQRAGRAGRRTDSVAFVLTYAQRRSHDLTHFNRPEKMVAGRILPPAVTVSNEKIVRRHVHSVFLAAFFRWAMDQHHREFKTAGAFFAPEDGRPSGPDLLAEYIRLRPASLPEALLRIVPEDLHDLLDIAHWGWLPRLTDDAGEGILDRAAQEVNNDLALYAELEQEAVRQRRYSQAEHFQRVAKTVRDRELLGFLGSRNVLPAYGFPSDVVELRTGHIPSIPEAHRIELQRDLKIAIAEYAPGGEVVAAKRIWTSGGLYRMPGRDWQVIYYAVCPECGRFHRGTQQIQGPCVVCGANLHGWRSPHGQFIIPEFGFVAAREPRNTGENRPQRLYASRVYFTEYAPEGDEPSVLEPVSELSGPAIRAARRYSRYGKLAVVNSGFLNAGFRICSSCGWAEPAMPTPVGRRPRREPAHQNPRTGHDCSGFIQTYHLGHEFITDVLELRFNGALAPAGDLNLWLSTLYALLEGASETLGIPRDDLDGTLFPYQGGEPPALVLFDNVPGGAGHVRRVAQALPAVVQAAWERVAGCECGEETSCYECLRNFYNQWCHDRLQRGPARDFLAAVRNRT
jgi:ATP-dependent helicase YprA (DUF1998 family)